MMTWASEEIDARARAISEAPLSAKAKAWAYRDPTCNMAQGGCTSCRCALNAFSKTQSGVVALQNRHTCTRFAWLSSKRLSLAVEDQFVSDPDLGNLES